jgi:hypothetical protein
MVRGDDQPIRFAFSSDAEFTEDDVVVFTVKEWVGDEDAVFQRTSTDNGVVKSGGTATTTIPAEETATYTRMKYLFYDWELTTSNGSVRTLSRGVITVLPDITT